MSDKLNPKDVDRDPTADEIRELPDWVRYYTHELVSRCDPAGDLRRLDVESQKVEELGAEVERLREKLDLLRERVRHVANMRMEHHYDEEVVQNLRDDVDEIVSGALNNDTDR